ARHALAAYPNCGNGICVNWHGGSRAKGLHWSGMMHPARLAAFCLAASLALLAAGADAADERLCSIKRIEPTTTGVNLYFTAARQVMLMHDQEGDLYLIDAAARESDGSANAPRTRHSLPLR